MVKSKIARTITATAATLALLALSSPALAQQAELGKKAPEFKLQDVNGNTHELSDFRGKIVVLHFQSRTCPWDKAYQSHLNEMAEKFAEVEREDGEPVEVQFLAINTNPDQSAESLASYQKKRDMPYPILKEEGNKVANMYDAQTTPHMYVIDREGVLRYRGGIEQPPVSVSKVGEMEKQYLGPVLQAITHGKKLPYEETQNKGCGIDRG